MQTTYARLMLNSFSNCWAEIAKMADRRIRNAKCAVGGFCRHDSLHNFSAPLLVSTVTQFLNGSMPKRHRHESWLPLPSLALYRLSCHLAWVLLLPCRQLGGSEPLKFGHGGLLPSSIAGKPLGLC
jgi:hypothetical protein